MANFKYFVPALVLVIFQCHVGLGDAVDPTCEDLGARTLDGFNPMELFDPNGEAGIGFDRIEVSGFEQCRLLCIQHDQCVIFHYAEETFDVEYDEVNQRFCSSFIPEASSPDSISCRVSKITTCETAGAATPDNSYSIKDDSDEDSPNAINYGVNPANVDVDVFFRDCLNQCTKDFENNCSYVTLMPESDAIGSKLKCIGSSESYFKKTKQPRKQSDLITCKAVVDECPVVGRDLDVFFVVDISQTKENYFNKVKKFVTDFALKFRGKTGSTNPSDEESTEFTLVTFDSVVTVHKNLEETSNNFTEALGNITISNQVKYQNGKPQYMFGGKCLDGGLTVVKQILEGGIFWDSETREKLVVVITDGEATNYSFLSEHGGKSTSNYCHHNINDNKKFCPYDHNNEFYKNQNILKTFLECADGKEGFKNKIRNVPSDPRKYKCNCGKGDGRNIVSSSSNNAIISWENVVKSNNNADLLIKSIKDLTPAPKIIGVIINDGTKEDFIAPEGYTWPLDDEEFHPKWGKGGINNPIKVLKKSFEEVYQVTDIDRLPELVQRIPIIHGYELDCKLPIATEAPTNSPTNKPTLNPTTSTPTTGTPTRMPTTAPTLEDCCPLYFPIKFGFGQSNPGTFCCDTYSQPTANNVIQQTGNKDKDIWKNCCRERETPAPTTAAPTTAAPTTAAPTTVAPTQKPTPQPTIKCCHLFKSDENSNVMQSGSGGCCNARPTNENILDEWNECCGYTEAPTTKAPTTKSPTTKAPTTKAPTTNAPVAVSNPTKFKVNLYFVLDKSGSVDSKSYNKECRRIPNRLPLSTTNQMSSFSCWDLFANFIENTIYLVQSEVRDINEVTVGDLDWEDESVPSNLQVQVSAFSCNNKGKTSVSFSYVGLTGDKEEYKQGLKKMRDDTIPKNGGTCPGQALEVVMASIEDARENANEIKPEERYHFVILVTDGLFTDGNRGPIATKAMTDRNVQVVVVSILGNDVKRNKAKTNRKNQLNQLARTSSKFLLYSFDLFNVANEIAYEITDEDLPENESSYEPYCGYGHASDTSYRVRNIFSNACELNEAHKNKCSFKSATAVCSIKGSENNTFECKEVTSKQPCNRTETCMWNKKKRQCVEARCTEQFSRKECNNFKQCNWNRGSCK